MSFTAEVFAAIGAIIGLIAKLLSDAGVIAKLTGDRRKTDAETEKVKVDTAAALITASNTILSQYQTINADIMKQCKENIDQLNNEILQLKIINDDLIKQNERLIEENKRLMKEIKDLNDRAECLTAQLNELELTSKLDRIRSNLESRG